MNRWVGRAILLAIGVVFALRIVQLRHTGVRAPTPRGSAAPSLAGPLLSGDRFQLGEERGHPVALVFWAPWCGPCIGELPGVERVNQALHQAPHTTRIIGVDTEGNAQTAQAAVARLGLTMPIVLDDGSASSAYQISTIPHTVIIDAAGKVAAVLRGASSEDELMRAIERVEKP
jgi:thiol-disulfide isomerase/thioredoxin